MENQKPNVIWVFGDQHRAQATGYMGDPNVHTPNLDRFAAEGMIFTDAVSGYPLCCPYRGSLISGRYPHHAVSAHQQQLPPNLPTIATVFNDEGYNTAYIGKWHLDGFDEANGRAAMHIIPPERRGGFKHWIGFENNNSQWDSWVHGGKDDEAFHYRLPNYESDELTNLFIQYLQEQDTADDPFFAVLSVQPPHDPYIAPADFMRNHTPAQIKLRPNVPNVDHVVERARRDLAGYYAMIENLDWNFGRIRQTLVETGLSDNTHIIFFSDHGDLHGSHGQFRKTLPYEESMRVPFIIGGCESFYALEHEQTDIPINHVDIAPTTLGLCGITPPDWMQGRDFSGARIPNRPIDEPDSAYLQLIQPTGHVDSVSQPWRGIVTRDGWKYITFEGMPWMLFNLNDDPYEQVNMAFNPRYQSEQKRLQQRLSDWIHDTDDSFDLPKL